MVLSGYKAVWLLAMFDLPVENADNRRDYTQFRRLLLEEGFSMMQYSVYARYFPSEAASDRIRKTIQRALPPLGQVRLITVTDRQFGNMDVFWGRKRELPEQPPEQMLLF